MANKILVKSKVNAAANPGTSDATVAELAVNTYSGKLYIGTNLGVDGTTDSTYIAGNNSAQVSWVGAPIDTTATLGTSDLKLATQNAIKTYVDAAEARAAQGLAVKTNVVGATSSALTVAAASTAQTLIIDDADNFSSGGITWNASTQAFVIDGVTCGVNDRILIKDAVTANSVATGTTSCGIYVLPASLTDAAVTLTRASDMNEDGEFANAFVFVVGGTANADTGWACTVDEGTQTFGAGAAGTSITFAQFNSAGTITAGAGLEKASGNTISVVDDGITLAMMAQGADGSLITYDASTNPTLVAPGTSGQVLTSRGAASTPTFQAASGSVSISGTPVNNQLAVWTAADTIEGESELTYDGTDFLQAAAATSMQIKDTTGTSTTTTGGKLILSADDNDALADTHRLGVIEFHGSEGTSDTLVIGARIDAVADTTWTGSENGTSLRFFTTDGTTEGVALTLDSDQLAAFTGAATIAGLATVGGTLGVTGVTTLSEATDSSSSTTGGTIISGGLGVAKKLYVGTDLNVDGLSTLDNITAAGDAATPGSGVSYSGAFNFTPSAVAEFGSGTHALIAGMTVNPFTNTAGAGDTTTTALLHLDGLPVGAGDNKYSLWCGGTNGTTVDGRIGGAIISGGTF
jgi:hypothetical protein